LSKFAGIVLFLGMTSKPLLVAALGAALASTSLVFGAAAPGPKARIFAKFDTNKNNVIDGDEIVAVRAAFAADPKGDLARFDTNLNGKLDDPEIAEIRPPGEKGAKGSKKDGDGKKKDATAK
jgi:hypothetical protein